GARADRRRRDRRERRDEPARPRPRDGRRDAAGGRPRRRLVRQPARPREARLTLDHVGIRVADGERSRRFYDPGFQLLALPGERHDSGECHEWSELGIAPAGPDRPLTRGLHVGLAARSREQVDEWWRALTAGGAPDDGAPGLRPQYSPDYYGAFVLDP